MKSIPDTMPPGAFEAPDGSTIPMHGGDNETLGDFCKIGIVTVSDRASEGRYKDISGLCILEVCIQYPAAHAQCTCARPL